MIFDINKRKVWFQNGKESRRNILYISGMDLDLGICLYKIPNNVACIELIDTHLLYVQYRLLLDFFIEILTSNTFLQKAKYKQAFLRYIRLMIQNNGQRKIRTKSRAISININSF